MRSLFTHIAHGDTHHGGALHLFYEGAQITATIERDPGPFDTAHIASRLILDTQHGPQPPK